MITDQRPWLGLTIRREYRDKSNRKPFLGIILAEVVLKIIRLFSDSCVSNIHSQTDATEGKW